MRIDRIIVPIALLGMAGCKGCGGTVNLGQGPEPDARLTADVYTWECSDNAENFYEGVFGFDISLEYAPDGLQERALPGGCVYGLSMFAEDAGHDGEDLPGLTAEPRWSAGEMGGALGREGPGYYYAEAFSNVMSCQPSDELVEEGVSLVSGAAFTGAVTPAPGFIDWVEVQDEDEDGVLSVGETVEVEWDAEGWDEVWIQVRKERDGENYGAVTCNVTGEDGFVVDEDVWDLFQGNVNVEVINLYVGFQNRDLVEMDDGQTIEVVTRGMHVLVVAD
mgnify:CR=1 FL=1